MPGDKDNESDSYEIEGYTNLIAEAITWKEAFGRKNKKLQPKHKKLKPPIKHMCHPTLLDAMKINMVWSSVRMGHSVSQPLGYKPSCVLTL